MSTIIHNKMILLCLFFNFLEVPIMPLEFTMIIVIVAMIYKEIVQVEFLDGLQIIHAKKWSVLVPIFLLKDDVHMYYV